MSEPILVIDSSTILPGRLDEVTAAIKEMVDFVETNEDRPVAYNVYIDREGTTMTVAQLHPDSASMELHMAVAAPVFAQFKGLVQLATMDVYGTPSDAVLGLLHKKAEMLGPIEVNVHPVHAGFTRV